MRLVDSLELTNIIFSCFFALEMLIKIVGLGPISYLKATSNVLDCIIVVVSLVELPSAIIMYECYRQPPDPGTDSARARAHMPRI